MIPDFNLKRNAPLFLTARQGGLEFVAFSYLDREKEKAVVKPPLSSIDCCGARVALQHCPISRNNRDYYSGSDNF